MYKKINKYLILFSLFLYFIILVYGGLGVERSLTKLLGFYVSLIFLFAVILAKRKINFPKGFIFYLVFFVFLVGNYLSSLNPVETFEYVHLFLTGGIFWIVFYNAPKLVVKSFSKITLLLGIIFGFLYIANFADGNPVRNSFSLFSSTSYSHNHIGDLWAALLFLLVTKRKLLKDRLPLVLTGISFVLISLSRSAYLALAGGFAFYHWKNGRLKGKRWLFVLAAFILVFLYAGVTKSLLFSRGGYIADSVEALKVFPQGVGVGNFGLISLKDVQIEESVQQNLFSSVAHNLPLEFLVGMGVWGLSFTVWLIFILVVLFTEESNKRIVYKSFFLAMTVNFIFDYTYIIPTMLYLWFSSLGIAQREDS